MASKWLKCRRLDNNKLFVYVNFDRAATLTRIAKPNVKNPLDVGTRVYFSAGPDNFVDVFESPEEIADTLEIIEVGSRGKSDPAPS